MLFRIRLDRNSIWPLPAGSSQAVPVHWSRSRFILIALLALALPTFEVAAGSHSAESLWSLYQSRDFFALREALPAYKINEDPRISYTRAATAAAFNQLDCSSGMLQTLLQRPIPDRSLDLACVTEGMAS